MSCKPSGDPEATQLSPAGLENLALNLAERMRERTDVLRLASEGVLLDSTNVGARVQAEDAWDELYRHTQAVRMWAAFDAKAPPTENFKRRAIVPRILAFDRLKTQVERTRAYIRDVPIKPKGEPSFLRAYVWPPGFWPSGLSYANAMGMQFDAAIWAVAEFEKHFGSFHIWLKQPQRATCESLLKAWENGDADFQDYLTWMRRHEFGLLPARPPCRACRVAQATGRIGPQCRCGRYDAGLDAYIVQVLFDMRTSGRLQNALSQRCKTDADVYNEIVRLAGNQKRRDETNRYQRQTVGYDCDGKPIKEPVPSLDAPEARVIDELFAERQLNEGFRWRYRLDWDEVAQACDDRTARELEQVLSGASVEEMGKANYEHFRRAIPKIRGIAWQLQHNH